MSYYVIYSLDQAIIKLLKSDRVIKSSQSQLDKQQHCARRGNSLYLVTPGASPFRRPTREALVPSLCKLSFADSPTSENANSIAAYNHHSFEKESASKGDRPSVYLRRLLEKSESLLNCVYYPHQSHYLPALSRFRLFLLASRTCYIVRLLSFRKAYHPCLRV